MVERGIFGRLQDHELLELAGELRLIVVMLVHRLGPLAAPVEHERGEAAHEALAAHQQLGWEAEIPATDAFERAHAHPREDGKLGDAGKIDIYQPTIHAAAERKSAG